MLLKKNNRGVFTYSERLVQEAIKYLGFSSYKHINHRGFSGVCDWGRDPISGFDCSGFVYFLLREIGYPHFQNLRHSYQMVGRLGEPIHLGLQKPGDLIFFSRRGVRATHVGIIYSDDEYIHAPGSKDTKVSVSKIVESEIEISREDRPFARYLRNPIAVQRILEDPDVVYIQRDQWFNGE